MKHTCPICEKRRGGAGHERCSIILQQRHLDRKRRSAAKTLTRAHVRYITNLE